MFIIQIKNGTAYLGVPFFLLYKKLYDLGLGVRRCFPCLAWLADDFSELNEIVDHA